MTHRRLLLLSSSNVHGYSYLEYATEYITNFLTKYGVSKLLFVPYAAIDHDAYLSKVSPFFTKLGYTVEGIHKSNPIEAVAKAEAIFIGGGNTFLLLKSLYDNELVDLIRKRVMEEGLPYIGSSAGTNVAAPTIHNTNDMPIVYPPTFDGLNLIPFNINPHYIEPEVGSKHKGETREERILQYHQLPPKYPVYTVLGLKEGAILHINDETATLVGVSSGKLFIKDNPSREVPQGTNLSYLLQEKL